MTQPRKRASEDEEAMSATFLGIGSVNSAMAPDDREEPGLWLPNHRSGSRYGGWQRKPIAPRRSLGFRPPT